MKKVSLFLILCFTMNCATEDNSQVKEFPVSFDDYNFSLDSIAENLLFIPLHFVEPIAQIKEIKYSDPYFYVATTDGTVKGKLSIFDKSGMTINTLNRVGQGPGEYLSIQQFFIDRNKNIYINSWHKVVVFDSQLNHIRDIKWPDNINFAEIYMYNGNIYFFQKSLGKLPVYDWVVTDTLGAIIFSKPFSSYNTVAYPPPFPLIVFENNSRLFRYRSISDTIFVFNGPEYKPEYSICRNFKDGFRMYSKEEISTKVRWDRLLNELSDTKLRNISGIYGAGNNWIVSYRTFYGKDIGYETVLLNRYTNTAKLIQRLEIVKEQQNHWGIPNDWLGYGAIKPEGVAKINHKNYIISFMDAVRLKDMVSSNGFKNAVPKRPEIKQKFQEIADTLTIEDNPVLLLLELK